MMTREEAVERLERLKRSCRDLAAGMPEEPGWALHGMALDMALTALRPVSREKVERMRGEWVMKHRHHGGFRRVTGTDDMGEQRTITIDERCEYDDRYCSKCGKQSPDNFLNFCGYCGAPMTDEAVDIELRRWKEAVENADN